MSNVSFTEVQTVADYLLSLSPNISLPATVAHGMAFLNSTGLPGIIKKDILLKACDLINKSSPLLGDIIDIIDMVATKQINLNVLEKDAKIFCKCF